MSKPGSVSVPRPLLKFVTILLVALWATFAVLMPGVAVLTNVFSLVDALLKFVSITCFTAPALILTHACRDTGRSSAPAAKPVWSELSELNSSLKARSDADALELLTDQLAVLEKVYSALCAADPSSDIKAECDKEIKELMSNISNYERQRDALGLTDEELTANLALVVSATEGCTSLVRTRLRVINEVPLSDFRSSANRQAAFRDLEEE